MEKIKEIIGRVKEIRAHKLYIGEEAANGTFRAKAFSAAQDYGDIIEALRSLIEKDVEIDPYRVQRAIHLLRHIITEKEASVRVCDEEVRPVVKGELWVFQEALRILEKTPTSKFFERKAREDV